VAEPGAGLIDTNIFIHAHTHDAHSQECRRFLAGLESGSLRAQLEPLVLHELSFALRRYIRQMSRADVAEYLLMVLAWDGVEADKDLLIEVVERWAAHSSLAFVDAYLAAVAVRRGVPVYSKNVRELAGQGIEVPALLPG
jgi:predicted nucleic acid-binding protein